MLGSIEGKILEEKGKCYVLRFPHWKIYTMGSENKYNYYDLSKLNNTNVKDLPLLNVKGKVKQRHPIEDLNSFISFVNSNVEYFGVDKKDVKEFCEAYVKKDNMYIYLIEKVE